MTDQTKNSKAIFWTGRVLKIILILFLVFDSSGKIFHESHTVKASEDIGINAGCLTVLGIYLIIATALYAIPKTAVAGALFITAFLGGAVAITYLSKLSSHPYAFPISFCILLWVAEYLQNPKLKMVL
jgi:hypothetical protein